MNKLNYSIIATITSLAFLPLQASAVTVIDTIGVSPISHTSGWTATAQTITAPAESTLTEYSVKMADPGGPREIGFLVYQWSGGPVGAPLHSEDITFSTGGVLTITGLNVALTPGQLYGMVIDLKGNGAQSVAYGGNAYAGGNGFWAHGITGGWSNFSGLDHEFRAVFDTADSDGDGIPDDLDDCEDSDLSDTITIEDCDSGVVNVVFDNGCTLADIIGAALDECAVSATNHGQFVSCMAHFLEDLAAGGMITDEEKDAIMGCVGASTVRKPAKGGGKK